MKEGDRLKVDNNIISKIHGKIKEILDLELEAENRIIICMILNFIMSIILIIGKQNM